MRRAAERLFVITVGLAAAAVAPAQIVCESYYRFLGDYPANAEPDWADDAQGLAHDGTHWIITQSEAIWRIPVNADLCCTDEDDPGVTRRGLDDYDELAGYEHFGDPASFKFQGHWYVLVGLSGDGIQRCVAVFHADSLAFVDFAHLTCDGPCPNGDVDDAWCAVDPTTGVLYFPYLGSPGDSVAKYTLDGQQLAGAGDVQITFGGMHHLLDEKQRLAEIRKQPGRRIHAHRPSPVHGHGFL